jgi:hypothetical protein
MLGCVRKPIIEFKHNRPKDATFKSKTCRPAPEHAAAADWHGHRVVTTPLVQQGQDVPELRHEPGQQHVQKVPDEASGQGLHEGWQEQWPQTL